MKSIFLKVMILMGFLIPSTIFESKGQGVSLQGFSLKVSPGALSYFGNLSASNWNLPKRIVEGSKFGIGVGVIKQFSPFFGIQAQFLAGSLYSADADTAYFAGSLTDFSLSARFDPLTLLQKKSLRFSPYLSVGIGAFSFRSVHRMMHTNVVLSSYGYNSDGITNATKETAMSVPIAIGLSYNVVPNLQVEFEHSLRITNTDILDCVVGKGLANDRFSLTSIGIRYTIPFGSAGNRSRTRASDSDQVVKTDIPFVNVFVDCEMPETVKIGQVFEVKARINKGNYIGPAKLIQKYPDGFTVLDDYTKSYSYSFTNQNLIIDWKQMPGDDTFTCTYMVKVGENLTGSQTIIGKFEYQQADGAYTVRFNKSIFVDDQKQINDKEIAINQLPKQDDSGISTKAAPVTKGNIKPSQPLTGVEFRVQCGAFRDKKSADTQLAIKFGITEIIQEEFTDGWYRYTVGSFRTYEDAAKYRDSFIARTKILSSFIVAYKDGHRVSKISDAFK